MNYTGKLYGRIVDGYFDTGKTSEDWDKMEEKISQMRDSIQYYFDVLQEVNGPDWNKRPDHVLSKLLEAAQEAEHARQEGFSSGKDLAKIARLEGYNDGHWAGYDRGVEAERERHADLVAILKQIASIPPRATLSEIITKELHKAGYSGEGEQ